MADPAAITEKFNGLKEPDGYGDKPLGGYALMTAIFATGMTLASVAIARSGRELPEKVAATDLILTGVATHKLSRQISKEKVTSFIRAPFTRYKKPAGKGEVSEEVRQDGFRGVIGELLLCPYCLSHWIASGFFVGLIAAPRPTRMIAGVYTAETLADFLQVAYLAAEKRT
jgi:hypothetical protein